MKHSKQFSAASTGTLTSIFVHENSIRELTATTAFVFSSLAYSITKFGQATHGKRTLATRVCCSRKTIQIAIKKLIEMKWIAEPKADTPSGTAFIFGEKTPTNIINSYLALLKKAPKNKADGMLIKVPVNIIDEKEAKDISRKKAARFRTLSYFKMYIAYRNATTGIRTKKATCAFKNLTAVAKHLNVTLDTLKSYLDELKEQSLIITGFIDKSLHIGANGALMEDVDAFANNLRKVAFSPP